MAAIGLTIAAVALAAGVDQHSMTGGIHVQVGSRILAVSAATGLDPEGAIVRVVGSGYDISKGIYVAFCAVPAAGGVPAPCGGGIDTGGAGGASVWVSSNPPPYGRGLAVPYGDGGSFDITLTVKRRIGDLDCAAAACAVVTRSDHTRSQDRSQDVLIPVAFGPGDAPAVAP